MKFQELLAITKYHVLFNYFFDNKIIRCNNKYYYENEDDLILIENENENNLQKKLKTYIKSAIYYEETIKYRPNYIFKRKPCNWGINLNFVKKLQLWNI